MADYFERWLSGVAEAERPGKDDVARLVSEISTDDHYSMIPGCPHAP
jgi:hypothetical protein